MIGEQVVHRTTLHWIGFVRPVLIAGLFAGLGLASTFFSLVLPFGAVLAPALVLIAVGFAVAAFVEFTSAEFGVTNKRVILKEGFIRRRVVETMLAKLEGIAVDQTIPGRILNYGTITVTGTGGTHEQFRRISNPLEFRRQVHEQAALQGP